MPEIPLSILRAQWQSQTRVPHQVQRFLRSGGALERQQSPLNPEILKRVVNNNGQESGKWVAELQTAAREIKEGLESDAVRLQQETVKTVVLVSALENDASLVMKDIERMHHEEVRRKSNRASWWNRPLRRHTQRELWSRRRGLQALREQDLVEGAGDRKAQESDAGFTTSMSMKRTEGTVFPVTNSGGRVPDAGLPSKARLRHRRRGLKMAYTPSRLLVRAFAELLSSRGPATHLLFDDNFTNGNFPPYVALLESDFVHGPLSWDSTNTSGKHALTREQMFSLRRCRSSRQSPFSQTPPYWKSAVLSEVASTPTPTVPDKGLALDSLLGKYLPPKSGMCGDLALFAGIRQSLGALTCGPVDPSWLCFGSRHRDSHNEWQKLYNLTPQSRPQILVCHRENIYDSFASVRDLPYSDS
ncbi:hypothetical protein BKA70DRAFT_1399099 [Coprinopsis sp. MPI-PUGE-AT-0042]|nr:hypothetical protein BKA70DRAFT_1399099 [Coprinopsis sp. MPI-PUGE-AT-0042]